MNDEKGPASGVLLISNNWLSGGGGNIQFLFCSLCQFPWSKCSPAISALNRLVEFLSSEQSTPPGASRVQVYRNGLSGGDAAVRAGEPGGTEQRGVGEEGETVWAGRG